MPAGQIHLSASKPSDASGENGSAGGVKTTRPQNTRTFCVRGADCPGRPRCAEELARAGFAETRPSIVISVPTLAWQLRRLVSRAHKPSGGLSGRGDNAVITRVCRRPAATHGISKFQVTNLAAANIKNLMPVFLVIAGIALATPAALKVIAENTTSGKPMMEFLCPNDQTPERNTTLRRLAARRRVE
jgi:hypothetical protein